MKRSKDLKIVGLKWCKRRVELIDLFQWHLYTSGSNFRLYFFVPFVHINFCELFNAKAILVEEQ